MGVEGDPPFAFVERVPRLARLDLPLEAIRFDLVERLFFVDLARVDRPRDRRFLRLFLQARRAVREEQWAKGVFREAGEWGRVRRAEVFPIDFFKQSHPQQQQQHRTTFTTTKHSHPTTTTTTTTNDNKHSLFFAPHLGSVVERAGEERRGEAGQEPVGHRQLWIVIAESHFPNAFRHPRPVVC